MTATYKLQLGEGEQELPIGKILVIGRSSLSDVILDDHSISRVHCRIVPYGNQIFLEDMGSANGTKVNGLLVQGSSQLTVSDTITVGPYTLQIRSVQASQPAPAPDGAPLLKSYTIPEGVLTAPNVEEPAKEPLAMDLELVKLANDPAPDAVDAAAFEDCVRVADSAAVFLSGNLDTLQRRDALLADLHQALRASAEQAPELILARMNRTLMGHGVRASALCARLDLKQRRFQCASAAHRPPFIVRANGQVKQVVEHASLELGQMATARFVGQHILMRAGETVVLTSAGLPGVVGAGNVDAGVATIREALGGQPTSVGHVAARLTALLEQRAANIAPPPRSCAVCFGLR